jgi:hypothetical protein
MYRRHKLGPVSGPPATKHTTSKDIVVTQVAKKLNLKTIISMEDFEIAASQHMKPRSFACKYITLATV